jgi:hypothetical protein
MIEKELTPEADFKNHVSQDPKIVHQIWALAMKYISRYVPLAAHQSLTLTADGAWHDLDVSAYVSATAFKIKFTIHATSTVGRWMYISTRQNGSAMDWDNIEGLELSDHTNDEFVHIRTWDRTLEQTLDSSKVMEYLITQDGMTIVADLVGYYETLA